MRNPVKKAAHFAGTWEMRSAGCGRMSQCDARDGGKLFEPARFVATSQGPLGIEIDGQQDCDQQSEECKTEFPEED